MTSRCRCRHVPRGPVPPGMVRLGMVRLFWAGALLLAGCGAPGPEHAAPADAVPAQARLAVRLEAYHRALGERDADKMYRMAPPYVRAHLTLDAFMHDLGMEADWAAMPHARISTRMDQTCGCSSGVVAAPSSPRVTRCVLLLDSTITDAGGKQRKFKNLEMWEYQKGEWYFGYPGGGAESCPVAPDALD